jgi:3-phenylpropionate/trans-cinnamate dioxygenase ferredoxin reductase component
MTDPDAVLIVGGGAAAHACVDAYREAGGDRPVVLASADDRLPYFRPAVSKEYLAGDMDAADLVLEPAEWYTARDVDVLLGCEVTGLDLASHLAATAGGEPLPWFRCVLATGSDPAPLPVPGADDPAVSTIRSAADTEDLLERLVGPVVIVGSGFVGCEAAASLRRRGCDVTIVSEERRPQEDRLGIAVGDLIAGWLADVGVELIGGQRVTGFDRRGDALLVGLPDRQAIVAGNVVVAVGARPRLALAVDAGLSDGSTLAVDAMMRTAAPAVFAVGDIATAWHSGAERWLRVEHWGDAEAHGRVAGFDLAGERAFWTEPPGFWSTIAGETIKHVAWGDGFDDIVVRPSRDGVTIWYGRDGVVVGVLTHRHDDDNDVAASALTGRQRMPSH